MTATTKNAKFTTIRHYNTAFGGWSYRAASNGVIVNFQRRAPGKSTFVTFWSMPLRDFLRVEERYTAGDPALLEHIAHVTDSLLQL